MYVAKKIVSSAWFFPALLFVGYAFLYFAIKDTFLYTPDFTSTDIFHYTISYKYYLWQSLRAGIIPWWTHLIGGGFPLLAESPVGMLFLPYYIVFPLFPTFSHAFAFLFCSHLFVMTIGMYLFLRQLSSSRLLSFLLSLTFVWNGAITFRWVHFTVLQAFSFTPLLFWLYKKWDKTDEMKYVLWFVFVLSQMILVGYIQAVFITLIGLCCLYFLERPHTIKKTLLGVWAIGAGVVISLPQLLPTLQLSTFTNRPLSNTYDFAVSVPFNLNNICSFFKADCLGSAKVGTYNTDWQLRGVYWENTPYMGILFMILIIGASIYVLFYTRNKRYIGIYFFLFILFTLLALGKNSPLYFLFSIFPFTMFRTPGRYLVLATFFLITYSSVILQIVMKKGTYLIILVYTLLIVNILLLAWTAFSYHVFVDSSVIYSTLQTQPIISKNSSYIIYGASEEWNNVFITRGWQTKREVSDYIALSKAGAPNSNLISGRRQLDIYASMPMRRNQFINELLVSEIGNASTSAHISNLLELYGISTIVSYRQLLVPHFQQLQAVAQGKRNLITYQDTRIATQGGLIYTPQVVQQVKTIDEVEKYIAENNMSQKNSLVESFPYTQFVNRSIPRITTTVQKDMYIKSTVESSSDTFLVYRISWYPEWELTIDNKKSPLYKTNLVHMGFLLPKGKHLVELRYIPRSFYIGSSIAVLFIALSFPFLLKAVKRST